MRGSNSCTSLSCHGPCGPHPVHSRRTPSAPYWRLPESYTFCLTSLSQDVFSSVRLAALRTGHGLPSRRLLSASLNVVPSSQRSPLAFNYYSARKSPLISISSPLQKHFPLMVKYTSPSKSKDYFFMSHLASDTLNIVLHLI